MDRKIKGREAILISDKIDFKKRAIKRDPEGHIIILKGRIHQEDKYCKYICTQHRSTQIHKENLGGLQKKDIDSNTIIVGDFNTPLSKMDRSSKQNVNKDIVA